MLRAHFEFTAGLVRLRAVKTGEIQIMDIARIFLMQAALQVLYRVLVDSRPTSDNVREEVHLLLIRHFKVEDFSSGAIFSR